MATRRSRIKAVANLPARRSRPAAPNDIKKEVLGATEENVTSPSPENQSCIKAVQPSENNSDGNSSQQPESTTDSQTTCDRKSVIVTVEKDRKSVIVNRDDCMSSTATQSIQNEEPSSIKKDKGTSSVAACPDTNLLEGDSKSATKQPITDISCSVTDNQSNEDGPSSASHINKDSSDSNACQNKRVPLRTRRAKPTVNLTGLARKRTANDISISSAASPPPSKMKSSELFQRKNSESENVNNDETSNCSIPDDQHQSIEATVPVQKQVEDSHQTTLPTTTITEAHSSPTSSKTSNSTELFKTPISISKSKDSSMSTSIDQIRKGDGTTQSTPQKDPCLAKRKPSANALRVSDARKNLKNRLSTEGAPPRASLTMFDLIFYNPSTNPMKSDPTPKKPRQKLDSVSSVSSIHEDRLNEESVDDIESEVVKDKDEEVEETAMPVPQVKVGPDGNLILDEQSLVIETTGTKKSREELERSEVVVDTGSGYGHYKKIVRSKDWSDHETKKFYRALNVVGTDFSLMKPYFRKRTRRELKLKFKKEEKLNPKLVTRALAEPLDFDISELEKECELEDEEEKRLEEMEKEKASEILGEKAIEQEVSVRKRKIRKPKGSKLLAELELQGEGISVVKKPPRPVLKKKPKICRDEKAEEDYKMLAEGIQSSVREISELRKNTLEELDSEETPETSSEYCILVDVPDNIKKQPNKRAKKKKVSPCQESEEQDPKPSTVDCPKKAKLIKRKQTKSLSESASENIPVSSTDKPVVSTIVPRVYKVPPKMLSVPHSPTPQGSNVPQSALGVPIPGVKIITTSNAKTPEEIELKSPPSLAGIPLSGGKVFTSSPLPRIQIVQTSPNTMAPSTPSGTTPRIFQIVRTPVSTAQPPSVTGNKHAASGSNHVLSKPSTSTSPPSSQSVQVLTLNSPLMSTSLVPTSESKAVTPSPISRVRTVQVTPQTVPGLSPFGTSTPVSRLLPSTPTLPRMEPGSIIVLKTPLPHDPDRHVLQVYMVTNTPQGTSPCTPPLTPSAAGLNLLSGPSVQPANTKSPCISDDSDCEKMTEIVHTSASLAKSLRQLFSQIV